jgi:hypothetical protein
MIWFNIKLLEFHFGCLKLNIIGGKTVNFLDLVINLNSFTNKLKFNLYIKPTFTFSYVLPESNHPSFVLKIYRKVYSLESEEYALI